MRARAAGAAGAWRARGESTLQGCPEPRAKQEEACVTEDGTLFSACPREGAPLRGWQGAQRARGRCPVRGVWAHLQQLLVLLCLCALLLGSQRHRSQLRLGEHHAASSSGQSGGARRAKMRRHRRFLRRTQRRRVRPGILRGSSVSHGFFSCKRDNSSPGFTAAQVPDVKLLFTSVNVSRKYGALTPTAQASLYSGPGGWRPFSLLS
jgi:hypothetical protein